MPTTKPTTVEEYIQSAPEQAQKHLREIREILRSVAPDATETLKWGQPVFEQGRILFSYSAYKSHLNFMPTRSTVEKFKDELKAYKTGHDTIQLPYDEPLPKVLIKELAAYRVKEVAEGALWKHKD